MGGGGGGEDCRIGGRGWKDWVEVKQRGMGEEVIQRVCFKYNSFGGF